MDEKELVEYLARQIENALNDEDGDVAELRRANFDRYYGKPYGDEEDGRSQFVTREVFEAVEWAIPSVLRFFVGDGRAVEFEPVSEEDEQAAEIETDVVNHIALHRNEGFLFAYELVKTALINPNAYGKAWVEEKTTASFTVYQGVLDLSPFEIDPDIEIVAAEERIDTSTVGPNGQPDPIPVYDVRVKRTKTERKIKLAALPPDEVLVSDSLTSLNLDDADFVCHRRLMTVSELVQLGHDPDELESLSADSDKWNSERVNRLFYEEEHPDSEEEEHGAQKQLWVHDCYARVDVDGDSIAELRHVRMIGDEIFENEEVDYQPFFGTASIIIPNKHVCMSYVEAVENLQLVSTVLTRQLLDNIYAHTDKRHFFNEAGLLADNSTMDNYLDATSSAIVVQGNPAEMVMPETSQPIIPELLQVIEFMKDQTQLRTGVAPQVSLDPAVLRDSTMGAFMGALEHASQRLEVLVRIIAETAIKPLYRKIHYLTRQYLNDPMSLKIRGSWLNANPQEWGERDSLTVNVGLGNQNKQAKMQSLQQQFQTQMQVMPTGMVTFAEIFNTLERLVEISGLGPVSRYFIEPSEENIKSGRYKPPQPPQPDPIQMGQLKALMMDAQSRLEKARSDAQLDAQKMRAEWEKFLRELPLKIAESQRKDRETGERVVDLEERRQMDGHKAVADVRNTGADTRLKDAQRRKLDEETTG